MLYEESEKYESRLIAIANTRLLFNTMEELEEFLGNHAIHSNGIKRCYPTSTKLRSAYRDCKVEVQLQTDDFINLDWLMRHYERAWMFYRENLARRKEPSDIAKKLLQYHYGSGSCNKPSKSFFALLGKIDEQNINIGLLTMLLLKVIPGYDSKSGDVSDIDALFEIILGFLQDFTAGCGVFDVLPVLKLAREEKKRTRLTLIYHTLNILDTYESFSTGSNIAETSKALKESCASLDVTGLWTDENATDFWKLDETINPGVFFATQYRRESSHVLTVTKYTLHFVIAGDGRLTAYFMHPLAMLRRLNGQRYEDQDNAWYISDYPESNAPDEISLVRTMHSEYWPYQIILHRANNPDVAEKLEFEIASCTKIEPHEKCSYSFFPSIYAITQDAIYVIDEKEECFYKLPRFTECEFESISIDDNVGIIEMDGRRYLAIDERLLYIPIKPSQLRKYGIEKVYEIE